MNMTENMKAFVEHNKKHKVVCAGMLTPEGEPVLTDKDVENSDRSRYIFSDGTEIVLLSADRLSAPDFKPIWDLVNADEKGLEMCANKQCPEQNNNKHQISTMPARFELEQNIMLSWSRSVDDLNLFYQTFGEQLDDKAQNYIIGLIEILEASHQQTFDSFERFLKEI